MSDTLATVPTFDVEATAAPFRTARRLLDLAIHAIDPTAQEAEEVRDLLTSFRARLTWSEYEATMTPDQLDEYIATARALHPRA